MNKIPVILFAVLVLIFSMSKCSAATAADARSQQIALKAEIQQKTLELQASRLVLRQLEKMFSAENDRLWTEIAKEKASIDSQAFLLGQLKIRLYRLDVTYGAVR